MQLGKHSWSPCLVTRQVAEKCQGNGFSNDYARRLTRNHCTCAAGNVGNTTRAKAYKPVKSAYRDVWAITFKGDRSRKAKKQRIFLPETSLYMLPKRVNINGFQIRLLWGEDRDPSCKRKMAGWSCSRCLKAIAQARKRMISLGL